MGRSNQTRGLHLEPLYDSCINSQDPQGTLDRHKAGCESFPRVWQACLDLCQAADRQTACLGKSIYFHGIQQCFLLNLILWCGYVPNQIISQFLFPKTCPFQLNFSAFAAWGGVRGRFRASTGCTEFRHFNTRSEHPYSALIVERCGLQIAWQPGCTETGCKTYSNGSEFGKYTRIE